jgi:hypothetical protein
MSRRRKVTNAEIGGPLPLRRRPSSYIDHDDGVARYSTGDGGLHWPQPKGNTLVHRF